MIIMHTICDKCLNPIPDDQPGIVLNAREMGFGYGNLIKQGCTGFTKVIENNYCKECGKQLILSMFPKGKAAELIERWTGEILVSKGEEVLR